MDSSGSDSGIKIPQHEIEALARCLYPRMLEFFASPEEQKEYAEWKEKQANNKKIYFWRI